MTVYVSRYAATGELARDRTDRDPPVVDLPLLTHVWRIVFEQQAREHLPRRSLWPCRDGR
jgi:hypothetical protein